MRCGGELTFCSAQTCFGVRTRLGSFGTSSTVLAHLQECISSSLPTLRCADKSCLDVVCIAASDQGYSRLVRSGQGIPKVSALLRQVMYIGTSSCQNDQALVLHTQHLGTDKTRQEQYNSRRNSRNATIFLERDSERTPRPTASILCPRYGPLAANRAHPRQLPNTSLPMPRSQAKSASGVAQRSAAHLP